jgi:hypothetical protein
MAQDGRGTAEADSHAHGNQQLQGYRAARVPRNRAGRGRETGGNVNVGLDKWGEAGVWMCDFSKAGKRCLCHASY